MSLIKFLQSRSRLFYFFLFLLCIISSLTNISILMIINAVLSGRSVFSLGGNNAGLFIVLLLVSFLTTSFFQKYMVELTNSIMFSMELSIVQKVRNASFGSFEKMGGDKVYAAIGDTRVLSRLPEIFVTLINALITIVCSLCYLFWVSPMGGVTILLLMAILLLVYLYRDRIISRQLNRVRDLQDTYFGYLSELINGFKQIRISSRRNHSIYNKYVEVNRYEARDLSIDTSKKYVVNELIGVYSWYMVLGAIIFILPALFSIQLNQLAAFIVTVLFMMAPVSQLIMFFPFYNAFKIAIERINKIDSQLAMDAVQAADPDIAPVPFESIRFENLVYSHNAADKNTFALNIADFRISREELVFITGGNGSGKTTFVNILTGLYKPLSGKVYIDEKEVSWEEFCRFSNSMAVVYTSHYLFKHNYDEHDLSPENDRIRYLQQLLNLEGILKISDSRIDINLSKGQQKRLALMLAMLENKPLIVLDEWAAEQDPQNRRAFYKQWLEIFRGMGKTIIAVSHDDDFYDVADRVIRFDYGRITSDARFAPEEINIKL